MTDMNKLSKLLREIENHSRHIQGDDNQHHALQIRNAVDRIRRELGSSKLNDPSERIPGKHFTKESLDGMERLVDSLTIAKLQREGRLR